MRNIIRTALSFIYIVAASSFCLADKPEVRGPFNSHFLGDVTIEGPLVEKDSITLSNETIRSWRDVANILPTPEVINAHTEFGVNLDTNDEHGINRIWGPNGNELVFDNDGESSFTFPTNFTLHSNSEDGKVIIDTELRPTWQNKDLAIVDEVPRKMTILTNGVSTWDDFITAFTNNSIVYCRIEVPNVGSRLAFMAYVSYQSGQTIPKEIEFQYYRSQKANQRSIDLLGDQVLIYKLSSANNGTWTSETRSTICKFETGSNLTSSYTNNVFSINGFQADWTQNDSSSPSYISNRPTLSTVATSGSYDDLTNTPTIPTTNDIDERVYAIISNLVVNGGLLIDDIPYKLVVEVSDNYSRFQFNDGTTIYTNIVGEMPNTYKNNKTLTNVKLGRNVTNIGDSAFSNCTSLASISIPDTITSIGSYSFRSCTNLTSIEIPRSITSVGSNSFMNCNNLSTVFISDLADWCEIDFVSSLSNPLSNGGNLYLNGQKVEGDLVIPDGVTSIGKATFAYCDLTSVTIPNSITNIDNSAFAYCTNLLSIEIPEGVEKLGEKAFVYCSNLSSISIPASVSDIGLNALSCCTLTNISVSVNNQQYSSVNNMLLNKDGTILIQGINCDVSVPNTVTKINNQAFYGFNDLVHIIIPDSVKDIGLASFYECKSLTDVSLPNSITNIGIGAFYNCTNLQSITLPESMTIIPISLFENCSNLKTVTIPSTITRINTDGFKACSKLTKVNISDLSAWCKIYFENVYAQPLIYSKHLYLNDTLLSGNLVIPNDITSINPYVFRGGNDFTSVTIPNGVTSIGTQAFRDCKNLANIIIPSSVTIFNSGLFSGCTKLLNVTFEEKTTAQINDLPNKYWGLPSGCVIHCIKDGVEETIIVP